MVGLGILSIILGVALAKGIGLLFVKLAKWVSGRSKRFRKGGRIHERWIKNCLAAGAGCVVAGALLFAVGFLNGGKNYVLAADLNQWKGSATKEDSTYGLEKTKIDDYSTLNVDLSSLNLQIVSSDDDSYYISYTTSDSKEKEPVSYDVKNKILTLKEDSDSNSYTHIDIGFLTAFLSKDKDFTTDENVVTLYVPTDARFQSANINSSFGDILINSSCLKVERFHQMMERFLLRIVL